MKAYSSVLWVLLLASSGAIFGCQILSGLDDLSTEQPAGPGGQGGGTTTMTSTGGGAAGATTGGEAGAGGSPSGGGGMGGAGGGDGGAAGSGGCSAGCIVANNLPTIVETLTVNSKYLIWATRDFTNMQKGFIYKIPFDNSAPASEVVNSASPLYIVADEENVYWSDNSEGVGSIRAAPLGATTVGGTTLYDGPDKSEFVAHKPGNLYAAFKGSHALRKISTPTGADVQLYYVLEPALELLLNQGYVIWNDANGIYRTVDALTGAGGNQTISAEAGSTGIATDGLFVFWTNNANGSVHRSLITSPAQSSVILSSTEVNPSHITTHAGEVYWVSNGQDCFTSSGAVRKRSIDPNGGNVQALAEKLYCPSNFAQTSSAIYWGSSKAIYKVDK